MSEVGSAITEARAEIAAVASEFMPDVCAIIGRTFTDGGATGDTLGSATLASGIPCSYKALGYQSQSVIGGEAYTASHKLTLPYTAITAAIVPTDRIEVEARGLTSVLIFEKPVVIPDALKAMIEVHATLVQQGYLQ